jgi:hypothetical protein
MKQKKLFCLLLVCTFLFSFSLPNNPENTSIRIVKSSESLNEVSFELTENTIMLKSDKEYKFYVEIKSKKVNGKKLLSDFSKEAIKGIQYKVIYTYEHIPSGKKNYYKDKYVVWESGEVINLKPAQKINVGKITLRTEIQRGN